MSGTGGKVALVNTTTRSTCGATCDGRGPVVDFVGWGASAERLRRHRPGARPPTPRRSRATPRTPTRRTTPPTSPPAPRPRSPVAPPARRDAAAGTPATIAEIQGTGTASPLVGDDRHHHGRRDRGLPDRRLQRLLHPDPGHRRRDRPGDRRRVRRRLRLPVRPAALPAPSGSATTCRSPAWSPSSTASPRSPSPPPTSSTCPTRRPGDPRTTVALADHRRRTRVARGHAVPADRRLHRHQHLHHQPVRRGRASRPAPCRCSSPPRSSARPAGPAPSRRTTPPARSPWTTARHQLPGHHGGALVTAPDPALCLADRPGPGGRGRHLHRDVSSTSVTTSGSSSRPPPSPARTTDSPATLREHPHRRARRGRSATPTSRSRRSTC